jgi:hypothetical protein
MQVDRIYAFNNLIATRAMRFAATYGFVVLAAPISWWSERS